MRGIRLGALLAALLLLAGCAAGGGDGEAVPALEEPVGLSLDTARVMRGEICEMEAFDFAVAPVTQELCFLTDGEIDEICVNLGQEVRKGDALVRLNVEREREEIAKIDERIAYLEKDNALTLEMMRQDIDLLAYEMENRDYKEGGERDELKQNEMERLKTQLTQEEERQALELAQLKERRAPLEERVAGSALTAPFDGRVIYLPESGAQQARAGQTLAVLADESRLKLQGAFVSQSVVENAADIWALVGGQKARVEYEPMDSETYISKLLSGEEMDTCFVFADGAPKGARAGDYAAVIVKTRVREDVLYIPPNSLLHDAAGYYVYRVGGGVRERVPVEVGYRNTTAVEIRAGLEEGDEIDVQ
jgi:multidrug efflux pump subunit AcrA (membrane-fusion protein)